MSFDTGICLHIYCAEWGYDDLLFGMDWAFNTIKAELPHLLGVTTLRGMMYLPFHPDFVWACLGQLQWPRHNSSKVSLSPHHGHLAKLSLGHQAQNPIYYFRTNHNWNCLRIGHGWDDQQQHIHIKVCDAWDLEVNLNKSKVWDGCTPIPCSSNNWPKGWICSARFS